MPFDIDKYAVIEKKKKTSLKRRLKYCKIKFFRSFRKRKFRIIKKIIKLLLKILVGLICFLIIICLFFYLSDLYLANVHYSIPEPEINGIFEKEKDYVKIEGLQKRTNDNEDTATLLIERFVCYYSLRKCSEENVHILTLNAYTDIIPHYYEYDIVYKDKNKIMFKSTENNYTTGVIDLNTESLNYTIYSVLLDKYKEIEVITNRDEIRKLERKIIRKYLKRKIFGKF